MRKISGREWSSHCLGHWCGKLLFYTQHPKGLFLQGLQGEAVGKCQALDRAACDGVAQG